MRDIKYPNGRPAIQQSPNDVNKVILLKHFVVIDSNGVNWVVPEGEESDGESSPEIFEPLAGDPFSAVVIPAVICHDYYTKTKERSQEQTHRIYYDLLKHEIKNNKEFKWFWALPWNNKLWQLSKAFIKWKLVIEYNRKMHPNWK